MVDVQEILHPDSETFVRWAVEEIVEKTDAELWEALEEPTADFLIKEVKRLNPEVQIETDPGRWFIFSSVYVEKLVLPEGFYYTQNDEITNKYIDRIINPVVVKVCPISHYDPDCI